MKISQRVLGIYQEIKKIQINKEYARSRELPSQTYLLDNDYTLIMEPANSLARHPYSVNGTTMWAYASGYISINNSSYYWVLPSTDGKEPYMTSFLGLKKNNRFDPISLISPTANRCLSEDKVKRYTVFGKEAVYYITKVDEIIYSMTAFMNQKEEAVFIYMIINQGKESESIYLSNYFNCLFKYEAGESTETKWFKKCTYRDNSFLYESPEDIDRSTHIENYGLIRRFSSKAPKLIYNTTAKNIFHGSRNIPLAAAEPLYTGYFEKDKHVTNFTETAVAGDIIHYDIEPSEVITVHYVMSTSHRKQLFDRLDQLPLTDFEDALDKQIDHINHDPVHRLKITFNGLHNKKVSDYVLNRFIENVIWQVDFSSKSSNSGTYFLGVRDVSQQLEASLIWNPEIARARIIEVLSFIDPSGRAPRQYSIPADGQDTTRMDLRPFIDQNIWIISLIYQYLAYTGDYGLLDEMCGYFEIIGHNLAKRAPYQESVRDHIKRMTTYLINNLDGETGCLKALYGDWNDALDGLGIAKDKGDKFGTGVSIMASFQFYANLGEIQEIMTFSPFDDVFKAKVDDSKKMLTSGLNQYAFVQKDKHERIVHGWGDRRSYYVGSFLDSDKKNRYSLTANAFYVNSGFYKLRPNSVTSVLESFKALDSKYGLKTFEPFFDKDAPGVGRIVNLPRGTAENGATYVHAALFGVMAYYLLDQGKAAWTQIEKVLPVYHEFISTSSFVMSNSYSLNLEEDMDGESMGDWYTGSSNTLIKVLVRGLIGFKATLDGFTIQPSKYLPCDSIDVEIPFRGTIHRFTIDKKKGVIKHD